MPPKWFSMHVSIKAMLSARRMLSSLSGRSSPCQARAYEDRLKGMDANLQCALRFPGKSAVLGRAKGGGGKTYRTAKPREDGPSETFFETLRKLFLRRSAEGNSGALLRDLLREMP